MLIRSFRHCRRVPGRGASGDAVPIGRIGRSIRLAAGLLRLREESDALLSIVLLHQLASFCEQRYQAGLGSTTPTSSQPACKEYRVAKRLAIQHGFDGVEVPPSGHGEVLCS